MLLAVLSGCAEDARVLAEGEDDAGLAADGAADRGGSACDPRWPVAAGVLEELLESEAILQLDRRYRWPLNPELRLFAGNILVGTEIQAPGETLRDNLTVDRAVLMPMADGGQVLALRGAENRTIGIRWGSGGAGLSFIHTCDIPTGFPVDCPTCPPPPGPGASFEFEILADDRSESGGRPVSVFMVGLLAPMQPTYFVQLYELSMACPPTVPPEGRDGAWYWSLEITVGRQEPEPAGCSRPCAPEAGCDTVELGPCYREVGARVEGRIDDLPPFAVSAQTLEITKDVVCCHYADPGGGAALFEACFDQLAGR